MAKRTKAAPAPPPVPDIVEATMPEGTPRTEDGSVDSQAEVSLQEARKLGALSTESMRANQEIDSKLRRKAAGEKHVPLQLDVMSAYHAVKAAWGDATIVVAVTRMADLLGGDVRDVSLPARNLSSFTTETQLYDFIASHNVGLPSTRYRVVFRDGYQERLRCDIVLPDMRNKGSDGQVLSPQQPQPYGYPQGYQPQPPQVQPYYQPQQLPPPPQYPQVQQPAPPPQAPPTMQGADPFAMRDVAQAAAHSSQEAAMLRRQNQELLSAFQALQGMLHQQPQPAAAPSTEPALDPRLQALLQQAQTPPRPAAPPADPLAAAGLNIGLLTQLFDFFERMRPAPPAPAQAPATPTVAAAPAGWPAGWPWPPHQGMGGVAGTPAPAPVHYGGVPPLPPIPGSEEDLAAQAAAAAAAPGPGYPYPPPSPYGYPPPPPVPTAPAPAPVDPMAQLMQSVGYIKKLKSVMSDVDEVFGGAGGGEGDAPPAPSADLAGAASSKPPFTMMPLPFGDPRDGQTFHVATKENGDIHWVGTAMANGGIVKSLLENVVQAARAVSDARQGIRRPPMPGGAPALDFNGAYPGQVLPSGRGVPPLPGYDEFGRPTEH
jgi:hypothetical protein